MGIRRRIRKTVRDTRARLGADKDILTEDARSRVGRGPGDEASRDRPSPQALGDGLLGTAAQDLERSRKEIEGEKRKKEDPQR